MKEQRQRSTKNPSLFRNLPEDLIPHILLRLPVRSLLRFKSVCKSWQSLMSDPKFGKSHFDLAASPTHRCLILAHGSEIESIDVDAPLLNSESSSVVKLKCPLSSSPPYKPVEFLGSCRGFVLVAYGQGDVIVWNPSTGDRRRLEALGGAFYSGHGFGYDKSTDDYLIVFIGLIPFDDYRDDDPDLIAAIRNHISIYSLKTNSWVFQEGPNVKYVDLEYCQFLVGCLLNDALHWLVISYETKLHVIIAFDLVDRSLSEIPLSPVLARKLKHREYHLRVMGECLSLCYPGDRASEAEIWMMKDYKVQTSWTKLFVFPTSNNPYDVVFYPICFTKHGEFFGSNGCGRLMIFNDKGCRLNQCRFVPKLHINFGTSRERLLHCGMYRETLLSFPNDFEEASEDDQLKWSLEKASEDDK